MKNLAGKTAFVTGAASGIGLGIATALAQAGAKVMLCDIEEEASIAGLISSGSIPYNVSKYGVVALSEGLRSELAPRGIGVSVLCPGFIRTQIITSARNLPKRFEGAVGRVPTSGPVAERVQRVRDRVSQGIDPAYVGELVREAIENDWPYIFTDTEFEPYIEARFAAIKKAFDRIRGRNPKH